MPTFAIANAYDKVLGFCLIADVDRLIIDSTKICVWQNLAVNSVNFISRIYVQRERYSLKTAYMHYNIRGEDFERIFEARYGTLPCSNVNIEFGILLITCESVDLVSLNLESYILSSDPLDGHATRVGTKAR